jgi:hypothetical protein
MTWPARAHPAAGGMLARRRFVWRFSGFDRGSLAVPSGFVLGLFTEAAPLFSSTSPLCSCIFQVGESHLQGLYSYFVCLAFIVRTRPLVMADDCSAS